MKRRVMNVANGTPSDGIAVGRLFITALAVYALLIVSFYFLAGDQLRYRESRGSLELPTANAAIELSEGMTVEQVFQTKIQRLERVSVQWGTYYRPNTGTVTMELVRPSDGEVLIRESYDAAEIAENQVLTMTAAEPMEALHDTPLVLRLVADSPPGAAAAPLIDTEGKKADFALLVNGEPVPGMLCFSAGGTDYIWTGLHYWAFAAALGAALALLMLGVWLRYRSGRHSYIVNAIYAMKRYRFLLKQLVQRDFKAKYKRSVLGIFWSLLNPLLTMAVQYIVFSTIFKNNIPNFAVYLLIGVVMFNFFSEACGMSLMSILGNANLITKVYVPKYIYPLSRTISSVINLLIALIPLIAACWITGVRVSRATVLAVYFMFCLIVFCLGLGLVLSTSMVFFRDTQFLWNVLSMMWMYATPIFYPETILPEGFKIFHRINPLYHFLKNIRMCILDGLSPEPLAYFQCFAFAAGMLLIGGIIFRKKQNTFVLYL